MKINLYEWVLIERRIPVIVGIGEGILGLLFVAIASSALPLNLPQWLPPDLLSNLGIGLLAAGITTGTLEPISRKRLQRDVEELKQAHFESILKGLMPEPIFDEVQAHIIRQPFLRENFRWTVELGWLDETHEYLCKSSVGYYEVKNASRTLESYELRASEERVNEDRFPGSTRIQEVQFQRDGDEQPSIYAEVDLDKFLEKTDRYVRVLIPFTLQPDARAKIRVSSQSIVQATDVINFVVNKPTIGMELTMVHPADLSVRAMPMHPSQRKFVIEVDKPTLKRWRIETGLLPFQGIEVSWCPFSPAAEGEEE